MAVNLPTELLRSFAAIVDAGSMLRATERVFVSQSALSLQMKRLEDLVQTPLFQREGRRLGLTPAGQSLLVHAREILQANDRAVQAMSGDVLAGPARIGFAQDFAETLLSSVLARLAELYPDIQVRVRVGPTPALLELVQAGQLDVVLATSSANDPAAIHTEPMLWLGKVDLARQSPLPLAVLEQPCQFRDAALAALNQAGRPYRIMLETPSLAALRAAVDSGVGLTARTRHFSDSAIRARLLPPLPHIASVLHVRSNAHPTLVRLGKLILVAARETDVRPLVSRPTGTHARPLPLRS